MRVHSRQPCPFLPHQDAEKQHCLKIGRFGRKGVPRATGTRRLCTPTLDGSPGRLPSGLETQVAYMDHLLGRLVDTLDKLGEGGGRR
jgi:hypothetical protein